jgi:hypothetical protein
MKPFGPIPATYSDAIKLCEDRVWKAAPELRGSDIWSDIMRDYPTGSRAMFDATLRRCAEWGVAVSHLRYSELPPRKKTTKRKASKKRTPVKTVSDVLAKVKARPDTARAVPFSVGRVLTTSTVQRSIPRSFLQTILQRFMRGDWGEVGISDAKRNVKATLKPGYDMILGIYDYQGKKVWIITEADSSVTTILYPEER